MSGSSGHSNYNDGGFVRSRSSSRRRNNGHRGAPMKKNSAPPQTFGGFRATRELDRKSHRWEEVARSQKGDERLGANDRDSTEDPEEDNVSTEGSVESLVSSESDIAAIPSTEKHPLKHSWTLWHFQNDTRLGWDANLVPVHTFRYIEDFWSLYNHLQLASDLSSGKDYCLFKEGIRPAWEDNANKNGGRWVIGGLDPSFRGQLLDALWLEVMMFLIGAESEDMNQLVNGAVVMVRNKGDKICVWCRNSNVDVMAVGKELKARLGIHKRVEIGFEDHGAAKMKRGMRGGPQYLYNV